MAQGRSVLLKLTGDPSDAQRALKSVQGDVHQLDRTNADVRVDIKTQALNAKLDKLNSRLHRLGQQVQTPEIKIRTGDALRQIEKVEHQLDGLHDKHLTIDGSGGAGGGKAGKLGALGALGGLAGLAGSAVTAGGIDAVKTSSDISEALSKNRVLFGKHAGDVEKFSKKSAAGLGISRKEALDATGVFGGLIRALGVGPEKAAKMSIALTKLAADLASFHNKSPAEALEALRAGLVGETEPLRAFAVNINDQRLRAEAKRLGLTKDTKSVLTAKQKGLAAQSLIFTDTKPAQGDVARTKQGLANQIRILRAEVSDRLAEAGDKLRPSVTRVARLLTALFAGKFKEGLKPLKGILIDAITLPLRILIKTNPFFILGKRLGKGLINGLIDAVNFGIRQVNHVLRPRDLGPLGHTPDLRIGEIGNIGDNKKGGVKIKKRGPSSGNAGGDPAGRFGARLAPNVTVQVSTPGGGSPDPRVLADQLGREIRRRGG